MAQRPYARTHARTYARTLLLPVQWWPMEAVNPLAGSLSGIFILIIAAFSVPYVRRKSYE